jgi:hypothetical protein
MSGRTAIGQAGATMTRANACRCCGICFSLNRPVWIATRSILSASPICLRSTPRWRKMHAGGSTGCCLGRPMWSVQTTGAGAATLRRLQNMKAKRREYRLDHRVFDIARSERSTAVVLAFQADPYLLYGLGGGFNATLAAITEGARIWWACTRDPWRRPCLHRRHLVSGFLRHSVGKVWRVEVPSALDIRPVRIRIDPSASQIFDFAAF